MIDQKRQLAELVRPPSKVVSLVPSLTASLIDLGFGGALVGVTDYCQISGSAAAGARRVGGPKDARLVDILGLSPDLVIANPEENARQLVEQLEQASIPVWLTFPKTVRESMDDLWALAKIFHGKHTDLQLRILEDSLQLANLAVADRPPLRYFCPIWQGEERDGRLWWMTFNADTYCHDLLRICGGENVFAARQRRYPLAANWGGAIADENGTRDLRYPVVVEDDIRAAQPEMILLPDEPFAFGEDHRRKFQKIFADTPAVKNGRVHRIDGRLVTWHGTWLGKSLMALPQLLAG